MVLTPDLTRGRNTRLRTNHDTNPEVDAIIDRALATIGMGKREQLCRQAMRKGLHYTPQLSEQTGATEFSIAP